MYSTCVLFSFDSFLLVVVGGPVVEERTFFVLFKSVDGDCFF